MPRKSSYASDSFYSRTKTVDFYLGYWNIDPQVNASKDQKIEIESKYHLRPDLMAYDMYGSPNLWWVFAMKNKNLLIDPVEDFKTGLVIAVPPKSAISDLLG